MKTVDIEIEPTFDFAVELPFFGDLRSLKWKAKPRL